MARTAQRKQFLSDVLITAVEAGWPWFRVDQYQYREDDGTITVYAGEQVGDDTIAIVCQVDDTDTGEVVGEPMTLDLDAIARGVQAYIAYLKRSGGSGGSWLRRANSENDAGEIDANEADNIVQMALLGEIVYG